jgi:hypothetical protein
MKKKFAFVAAAIALTFGALVPSTAEAGHRSSGYYVTKFVGYDHCGRPVYRQVWVEICQPRPVCPPVYYGHGHGHGHGHRRSHGHGHGHGDGYGHWSK